MPWCHTKSMPQYWGISLDPFKYLSPTFLYNLCCMQIFTRSTQQHILTQHQFLLFQIDWLTLMLRHWRTGIQTRASVATHYACVCVCVWIGLVVLFHAMCIPFALLLCAPHAMYSAAYHPCFCFHHLPTTSDLLMQFHIVFSWVGANSLRLCYIPTALLFFLTLLLNFWT